MKLLNLYWFQSSFFAATFLLSLVIDFEFMMMVIGFFFMHMLNGLKHLIFDYIHMKKLNFFVFTLMKLFLIKLLIYLMEILF